jgi:ParB family chromosome partitioning protein
LSADALVKAYQEETDRKRVLIRRTEITRNRLVFIVEALRQLRRDEQFVTLLEDEDLAMLPDSIGNRLGMAANQL